MTFKKENTINLGRKGWHHTEETKEKIRQFQKKYKKSPEHLKKISEALKGRPSGMKGKIAWNKNISWEEAYGKKYADKRKLKQSKEKSGKNNSSWVDGRSQLPYPNEFRKIKQFIYKKYNYTCQKCNIKFKEKKKLKDKNFITAHHIDYNTQNNKLNNLIALCNFCNVEVNKNRRYWKNYFT